METLQQAMTLAELQAKIDMSSGLPPIIHVKIHDTEKERWTDIWLQVGIHRGRVFFQLYHERGYPSEQRGHIVKTVITSWLLDKRPGE